MSVIFSEKDRELAILPSSKSDSFAKKRLIKLLLGLKKDKLKILIDELKKPSSIEVPVSIFNNKLLGPLESLVKYLKEEKRLSYQEIGKLLNREFNSIGVSYRQSKKKLSSKLDTHSEIYIPIEVLADKKYSLLENLVSYIKDELKCKSSETALLLNKDPSTIYTIYLRYKKRGAKRKKNTDKEVVELKKLFLNFSEFGQNYEEIIEKMLEPDGDFVPISIFQNDRLSVFEAITKYLRENKSLSYKEIGERLERSHVSIGLTYRNACKKQGSWFIFDSEIKIPLSIFRVKGYSVLESMVSHLRKEKKMSLLSISQHLKRKPGTIRKIYMRYRRKSVKE